MLMLSRTGGNPGEVESPLPGEIRLQSDYNIARDSRTACEWQSFVGMSSTVLFPCKYLTRTAVDDQQKLQESFGFIFTMLSTLGHDMNDMIDCSDVIPTPKPFTGRAFFPAGTSLKDVEQAVSTPSRRFIIGVVEVKLTILLKCVDTPFPSLPVAPGPTTSIAAM